MITIEQRSELLRLYHNSIAAAEYSTVVDLQDTALAPNAASKKADAADEAFKAYLSSLRTSPMSDPTPNDLKVAREIVEQIDLENDRSHGIATNWCPDFAQQAIAQAIADERERAAKIADGMARRNEAQKDHHMKHGNHLFSDACAAFQAAGDDIAAAIRGKP